MRWGQNAEVQAWKVSVNTIISPVERPCRGPEMAADISQSVRGRRQDFLPDRY